MLKMNTVVITGATGFIGGALTKRLLLDGKKVYAISTNEQKLNELKQYGNIITIQAKFDEYDKISDLIKEDVDIWFHFAWQGVFSADSNDVDVQLDNVKYACKSLLISKELQAKKYIFIGSAAQYKVIEKEKCIYNPAIYGSAKSTSEDMLKTLAIKNEIELNNVIFNNIFGVGDTSNRSTNSLIKQLKKNIRPKLIEGNHYHDWTYIDDALSGLIEIATKGINMKSYYVGSRELMLFKDIVKEVASIISPDIELIFGEYEDNSYIDYNNINLNELYNDTGFYCKCDFKESILKTAKWLETLDT